MVKYVRPSTSTFFCAALERIPTNSNLSSSIQSSLLKAFQQMWAINLPVLFTFVLITSTSISQANSTTENGVLNFHVMAVFPEEQAHSLARAFRKATSDVDSGLVEKEVTLAATAFSTAKNSTVLMDSLCDIMKRRKPSVVLSFADKPSSFYVSLIAGYARIPVIGMSRKYVDEAAKDVNPFYASLDQNANDLADAVYMLLKANSWMHAIVIRDDSGFSRTFARHLLSSLYTNFLSPKADNFRNSRELELTPNLSDSEIFQALGDVLPRVHAKIVIVHCHPETVIRIFAEAAKANLLQADRIWILVEDAFSIKSSLKLPVGILGVKMKQNSLDKNAIRSAVEVFSNAVEDMKYRSWVDPYRNYTREMSCWFGPGDHRTQFTTYVHRKIQESIRRQKTELTMRPRDRQNALIPVTFDIYNLLPSSHSHFLRQKKATDESESINSQNDKDPRSISTSRSQKNQWRHIGSVSSGVVSMNTALWLMSNRMGPSTVGRQRFRVVTALSPPFVMAATRVMNGSCLLGVPCLQVRTNSKEKLHHIFADYYSSRKKEGITYNVTCCAGIAIDLMNALSRDLAFDVDLYLVGDGYFGTKKGKKWNGITADLMSGAAHMVFSAYSMTSSRSEVVDFSVPFFNSGVSCLTYTRERDVPLSAFLVPFSFQLWVAIFASLNATAVCAAIYEWLSPFGLNPWGRMRSKNFSLASALWVMWSLLFSHLVAFKAPKSWPNKVLINLWGCFSVIFVSSYTANIAAHFAGLFFHLRVDDFHDASLLNQRTGTAKSSAAESYVFAENPELWQHIQNYGVNNMEEGLEKLRKGELDVLIGDTSVLDYFRGNEPGCGLHLLGQSIFNDAYAVGMQKGFPLKEAISTLILRYEAHGFVEQLQKKWYGRVPCFTHSVNHLNKPKPLSIGAVAGVFLMLVVGLGAGIVILVIEHMVFKHALPILREKPRECFWKSPNLMFFSQKLYRFINTVELVSPHHSAKEIVTNLKEGQIFSLFQKSVKRKAKEEARRRKSKSQFFEIIQEIRNIVRTQQQHRLTTNVLNSSPRIRQPHQHQLALSPESPQSAFVDDECRLLVHHRPVPSSSPRFHHQKPELRFSRKPVLASLQPILSAQGQRYSQLRLARDRSLSPTRGHNVARHYSNVFACESSSSSSEDEVSDEDIPNASISISVDDLRLDHNGSHTGSNRPLRQAVRFLSLDDLQLWKQRKKSLASRDIGPVARNASAEKALVSLSTDVDELLLYSMSKEEILTFWQDSERKLLNTLRDALKEKRALEEKLAFMQRALIKPP